MAFAHLAPLFCTIEVGRIAGFRVKWVQSAIWALHSELQGCGLPLFSQVSTPHLEWTPLSVWEDLMQMHAPCSHWQVPPVECCWITWMVVNGKHCTCHISGCVSSFGVQDRPKFVSRGQQHDHPLLTPKKTRTITSRTLKPARTCSIPAGSDQGCHMAFYQPPSTMGLKLDIFVTHQSLSGPKRPSSLAWAAFQRLGLSDLPGAISRAELNQLTWDKNQPLDLGEIYTCPAVGAKSHR